MEKTTNITTTMEQFNGGNSKYMANGVNHGFSHCIIDTTNSFIIAYGTKDLAEKLLKVYDNENYIVVDMLTRGKVQAKVQAKLQAKEEKLRKQLEQLQQLTKAN